MIDCNPMYVNIIFMFVGFFIGTVSSLLFPNKNRNYDVLKSKQDFDGICSSLKDKICLDETLKTRIISFNIVWKTFSNICVPNLSIEFKNKEKGE